MAYNSIMATINTEKGNINIHLFPEYSPITVVNFINLSIIKYYDEIKFHHVINEFIVQSGDPTGKGNGNPGYHFEDEINKNLNFSMPGKLAMVNTGPNTNGSQFFITTVATKWFNNRHTIFGELTNERDMKILRSIVQGDIIHTITLKGNLRNILLEHKNRILEWNKVLKNKGYLV